MYIGITSLRSTSSSHISDNKLKFFFIFAMGYGIYVTDPFNRFAVRKQTHILYKQAIVASKLRGKIILGA